MAERTIDLRKTSAPGLLSVKPTKVAPEAVEWLALEFEERERGPYWFLFPGVAALALMIFAVLTKSWFFAAFVLLAFVVLWAYVKRGPRQIACKIGEEGVRAGETVYPYSDIKSFWIFERGETRDLSLETKSVFSPYLNLPLGDTDPEKVRGLLLQFIPETEHKELATDQIARSLGL